MEIHCTDGRALAAEMDLATATRRGVVVMASATGVRRQYYAPLAEFIAAHGFDVLRFDPRGIGDSRVGDVRRDPTCMRDWGVLDIDAALRHAAERADGWGKVCLIGHSSGGHLAPLGSAFASIRQAVFIASGTCNWRLYPRHQWPRLLAAWYGAVPVLTRAFGYLPGWAGVGVDLPLGVARDWRGWSVAPDYLFSDSTLDTSGYASWPGRLHAISIADDSGFSPPPTVHDLLRRFQSATVTHEALKPDATSGSIGHFGFFQPRHSKLWSRVIAALEVVGAPL